MSEVVQQRGYKFPVVIDPGDVHRQYGINLRPTTVIVGPDGVVRSVRVGVHTAEQMRATLQRLNL